MVIQYKCPDCGADMSFDSSTGMLSCQSCGRKDSVESANNHEKERDYEEFEEQTSNNTFAEDEAAQFHCNNCGATIITDADTTATTCSFCGSPVVLGDRLKGSLAPSKVIPFSINKQQAQEGFKKWCRKNLLTPKGFMNADRIKSITGMYVPFWLYDLNGRGEANATCTKVRVYEDDDYVYTETDYYDVYRKVDLNYSKIPVDASEKMNDQLMDKLEPFQYVNLKEFSAPYLAGFVAEKYNYTDKEVFPRAKARTEGYVKSFIQSTITGYTTTSFDNLWIDIKQRNADYTLLPVWMFRYDYQKKEYIFGMNGQTGKIVGKPPLSIPKIILWFAGISSVSFLILKVIEYLWGGFIA